VKEIGGCMLFALVGSENSEFEILDMPPLGGCWGSARTTLKSCVFAHA